MASDTNYPAYIERDTYEGPWVISRRNARASVFSAAELAAMSKPGKIIILWESFRCINGVRDFGRSRFLVQPDGSLVCYTQTGTPIIQHPADRKITVLVK